MTQYIDKSALVAEIERSIKHYNESAKEFGDEGYNDNVLMEQCKANACEHILSFIDTLEVTEVDIDKLCEVRKNIGFAYPEGASEYQKQLACYRQGIKDAIKTQKGE